MNPALTIKTGTLDDPAVIDMLDRHMVEMHELSPPESIHALDLDGLRAAAVTFWSVWQGDTLLGCGALKQLTTGHGEDQSEDQSEGHGEIKSMHTLRAHRGKGVGTAMLQHIIDEATARGYARLSLETGSMATFKPAVDLYARFGFTECPPFADYVPDPNSIFMTLALK